MRRRLIIGVALLVVLAAAIAAGAFFFAVDEPERAELLGRLEIDTEPVQTGLGVSGFIEAEEIALAADIGGRVVDLPVDEGDEVQAGQVVVRIDTALLDAQRDAAAARVEIARAERDLLAAGVPDEVIAQAEAQVAIAEAAVTAAGVALQGAAAVRNDPQQIEVQVVEAAAQVASAQHQVNAANAQLNFAGRQQQVYDLYFTTEEKLETWFGEEATEDMYIPLDLAVAPLEYTAAVERLNDVQAALGRSQEVLDALGSVQADPQQLQGQVVDAQAALNNATAELARATAELEALKVGPGAASLAVADSRVAEAESALAGVEAQIEHMVITAPQDGIVLERAIHPGELAAPGVPVITLANLDTVELTVYVSAGQLDKVALDQAVTVRVDSFPRRSFTGGVVNIADEAEFTPRSVQTAEERVNLVYAVKIRIDNPDHALKPGMPADVRF